MKGSDQMSPKTEKVSMKFMLVSASLTALWGCQQSPPQSASVQRYQISATANGNAWKIDTQTGTTWLCTPSEAAKINIGSSCTVSKDTNEMPPIR